ncbi:MAG: hypothetical protein NUV82_01660 [Candidatus Komeilibacteria bacterium]|nr:hypothetical protein [Candidatus Komeilibacteria bacterium]
MAKNKADKLGSIKKVKGGVVVEYNGRKRIFTRKPIFFPEEYEKATRQHLEGKDTIVLGMNGYSHLSADQCAVWGVKVGAYEEACKSLLANCIRVLQTEFPGIDVRIAHGASNMGVDAVAIEVARRLNIPHLGHSCPHFMMYVEDDDVPVYVAASMVGYADSFMDSLDILIGANGRLHSFMHDIDAVFKKLKHFVPVNVLRTISTNGGPPALGAKGEIEDAVAVFEQRVHLVATRLGMIDGADQWKVLSSYLTGTITSIARQILSPHCAFSTSLYTEIHDKTGVAK